MDAYSSRSRKHAEPDIAGLNDMLGKRKHGRKTEKLRSLHESHNIQRDREGEKRWSPLLFDPHTPILEHARCSLPLKSLKKFRSVPSGLCDLAMSETQSLELPLSYTAEEGSCSTYEEDVRRRSGLLTEVRAIPCTLLVANTGQDELTLPLPGKFMVRGDSICMVSELNNDDDWKYDPLPRLFAYAVARNDELQKLKKAKVVIFDISCILRNIIVIFVDILLASSQSIAYKLYKTMSQVSTVAA
eukprot:751785-Hanusia_phi.AAC.2